MRRMALIVAASLASWPLYLVAISPGRSQDAAPQGARSGSAFTDITQECGVAEVVRAHYSNVPEWWLSGMTLVDLDSDGDLDLHQAGHGSPAAAAYNDGTGRFTYVDPKLSAPRGVRHDEDVPYPGGEIRLAHDFNEDGKVDLLISWHDGGGVLYPNDCRAGRPPIFSFKRSHNLDHFSRGCAIADMDRDGIADYLASADSTSLDVLFRERDGTFGKRKWSMEALEEAGAIPVDIDADGDLDYLVSQRGYNPARRWILVNDGKMNFANVTERAGLDEAGGSIHGPGDVDADGDLDLFCIEGRDVVIYLNDGEGRFERGRPVVGLDGVRSRPSSANWGGVVVTDFDNDGVADAIINGRYFLYVLRGLGGGEFAFANAAWGLPTSAWSAVDEGLCFGDIDADGDLDLITCGPGPEGKQKGALVFRNDLPRQHWLRLRLVGAQGNRAATSAKVWIRAVGDPKSILWYEQVATWGRQSFHSYYAAAQTERHFGLGKHESVDVSVEFYPSGKRVERKAVRADATVVVAEGGADS